MDELVEGLQDLCCDPEKEPFDFLHRPLNDQDGFVGRRLLTLAASQELVKRIFDEFAPLGRASAAEFGSGAYGCFYNFFLPERWRRCWRQYEINPLFVENNRQFTRSLFWFRNSSIEVGDFYAMPFDDATVGIIAGLSSWDGCNLLEKAAREISRCLTKGGVFLHFQDIGAGEGPLYFESRRRFHKGLEPTFLRRDYLVAGAFGWKKHLLGIESVEHGNSMIRSSLYMTEVLAAALRDVGLDIVHCGEMHQDVIQKRKKYEQQFRKLGLRSEQGNNHFETAPCQEDVYRYDHSLNEGYVRLKSSMDIIVARKV